MSEDVASIAAKSAVEATTPQKPEDEPIVERVRPSAFAGTFLNKSNDNRNLALAPDNLSHGTPAFDFKTPSPDDVVYRAQTGRTQ